MRPCGWGGVACPRDRPDVPVPCACSEAGWREVTILQVRHGHLCIPWSETVSPGRPHGVSVLRAPGLGSWRIFRNPEGLCRFSSPLPRSRDLLGHLGKWGSVLEACPMSQCAIHQDPAGSAGDTQDPGCPSMGHGMALHPGHPPLLPWGSVFQTVLSP